MSARTGRILSVAGLIGPFAAVWIGLWLVYARAAQRSRPIAGDERIAKLEEAIRRLNPLAENLGEPRPGDWRYHHRESGQTFREWLACDPRLPRGERTVLYIQPIGQPEPESAEVIKDTARFLGLFYNLEVKTLEPLPMELIPQEARRASRWGEEQILTAYVLDKVLLPRLPDDAAACLGLTSTDLWPGRGWNFVFGQASLRKRVGVWSTHRFGDPSRGAQARRTVLLRTIKTAAHETGHMFGMEHCTAWQCCMCGSNSLEESDARPLAACPQCVAKICVIGRIDPIDRYRRLLEFCRKAELNDPARFYARCIEALGGTVDVPPPAGDAETDG